MGTYRAATMTELLPPVDGADVATKADVHNVERQLRELREVVSGMLATKVDLQREFLTQIYCLGAMLLTVAGVTVALLR